MPRGDKTGPLGAGAMTGRGMGFCAGYNVPGYMNPGFNPRSRGEYGFGRGMGRGNRWGYYATGQPGWARRPGWDYGFPGRSNVFTQANRQDEIQYLKIPQADLSNRSTARAKPNPLLLLSHQPLRQIWQYQLHHRTVPGP